MSEEDITRERSMSALSVRDRMKLWKQRDDKTRSPSQQQQSSSRPSSRRQSKNYTDQALNHRDDKQSITGKF